MTRSPVTTPGPEGPQQLAVASASGIDPLTAMTQRFGRLAAAFARRFFRHFEFAPEEALRLRELESRGAVIYVMRYGSRLDYLLFNWLFLASGIRLSSFANGIRFYYYRPILEAVRLFARALLLRLRLGARGMRERNLAMARESVVEGRSFFLFLRTDQIRSRVRRRQGAVAAAQSERDYLREVIETAFERPVPVSLVPLALFWRKGVSTRRRFLNVFYGAPERPTDTYKVLSFLWNYRHLALRVGTAIDLRQFVDERRGAGPERLLKQVRRSLLIFLRREEKPVLGAALRPTPRIEEAILDDPPVRREIEQSATAKGRSVSREERRALRQLRGIAANPSPTMLALLDLLVSWMFSRLFVRIDVHGLERIVEEVKLRPVVLLPTHRSHFDYLILSWLFYENHLVPPLVAAGDNLSFWPLGPIFRRAGGYFLRRSFRDDRLYARVFRSYVQLLLKDGITQEFFIEGTRSRTGKTLQPRFGMLNMVLEAFDHGVRRDVSLVPVGFTYERLVEEVSMTQERGGGAKTKENLLQLIRGGSILRSRFGAVNVRFGEPISLAAQPDLEPGRIADEVCRRLNSLVPAGRSSVSAAALLGGSGRALRVSELGQRVREVSQLLDCIGVPRTEGLEEALECGNAESAVDLLLQGGLVERLSRSSGDLVSFSDRTRDALVYYRTTIAPALAWPAVLGLTLPLARRRIDALREGCEWLELLRLEYFSPDWSEREALLSRLIDHMVKRGWVSENGDGELRVSAEGAGWLEFLAAQIAPVLETYRALFSAVAGMNTGRTRKRLLADAQTALEDQLLLGEARHSESVCPITLGNALQLLIEEQIVSADGNPRAADTVFEPGLQFLKLRSLQERLSAETVTG